MKIKLLILGMVLFYSSVGNSQNRRPNAGYSGSYYFFPSKTKVKSETIIYYTDVEGKLEKSKTSYLYYNKHGMPLYIVEKNEGLYNIYNQTNYFKTKDKNSVEGYLLSSRVPVPVNYKISTDGNSTHYEERYYPDTDKFQRDTTILTDYGFLKKHGSGIQVEYHTKADKPFSKRNDEDEIKYSNVSRKIEYNKYGDVQLAQSFDTLNNLKGRREHYYSYYDKQIDKFYNIETTQLNLSPIPLADFGLVSQYYNVKFFDGSYFYQIEIPQTNFEDVTKRRRSGKKLITNLKTAEKFQPQGSRKWKQIIDSTAQLIKPIPTGNKLEISGINCIEYSAETKDGNVNLYYVDKKRKYIDYGNFKIDFPGFVVKSIQHVPDFGKIEWQVNPKEIPIPSRLLYPFANFFFEHEQNKEVGK